jgi:hypothetical protein
MAAQARQMVEGTHPHQRALASLIEDGAYHRGCHATSLRSRRIRSSPRARSPPGW